MRYPGCLALFFMGILFHLTGCNRKEKNLVRISINYPKAAGDTITIGRTNMVSLGTIVLGKIRLDSAGKGVVEIVVKEPVLAHINSKNMVAGLLIAPGDQFQILPAKPGAKHALRFEGDGAAINQVYVETERLWSDFDKWKGTYSFRLEGNEFLKAKDSLQKTYDQLLAKLENKPEVPAEKLDLLKRHVNMHVIFYQYNFAAGKDSAEIPQSVMEVVHKLPVDTIALKAGSFNYALVVSNFYREGISNVVYEEDKIADDDTWEAVFPTLVEKKIKASHYPKLIEDLLRVKSVNVQIGHDGLTPQLHTLAKTLEKEILSEDYRSVIREDIARWEKLAPGKPAPDFTGTTPDGKKISLSGLRGKVVYVDIWATWCGPCVEEFPESKKVQAGFKGSDQVAFLYVSVDRDTLAWKNMVASGKVPNGIHINENSDSPHSVWNLYHVWGIPRYLLIDAQGRMVATHAARPSSGDVQVELRKLLGTNRVAQR